MTRAASQVTERLRVNKLQEALTTVFFSIVDRANKYVDQTAPFRLAKDPAKAARLDEVLYNLAETCRILAVLLWPFIPTTAEKIYAQLGLQGSPDRVGELNWGGLNSGRSIGEPAPLFPRRDKPKE